MTPPDHDPPRPLTGAAGSGGRHGSSSSDGEPVVVARFHYRHQGELAHGYLKDAGIDAGLFVDDAGGMEVGLAFANPARLVVRPGDEARAREVLRDAGILDDG